jgi:hypothetical protein
VIAEIVEELHGEFAYLHIILHHQDVSIAANIKSGVLMWHSRRNWFRRAWKEKGESGTATLGAVDRYFAAGLLDATLDLRQAKPGTAPDLLRGEERLEHVGE